MLSVKGNKIQMVLHNSLLAPRFRAVMALPPEQGVRTQQGVRSCACTAGCEASEWRVLPVTWITTLT